MHNRSRTTIAISPSHPHNVGTESVGFSPTRKALLAPSAKRREVFGESCMKGEQHPIKDRL